MRTKWKNTPSERGKFAENECKESDMRQKIKEQFHGARGRKVLGEEHIRRW